jgi:putative Mn2+ efflux pump MntP
VLIKLILLGVALAANNALAAVGLGTTGLSRRQQLGTAFTFAVFEATMPLIGLWLGHDVALEMHHGTRWLGGLVLFAAGAYMLFKSPGRSSEPAWATVPTKSPPDVGSNHFGSTLSTDAKSRRPSGLVTVLVLAVALSLDNLSVGFGLGLFHVSLWMAAVVFGSVSLLLTWVGLECGRWIGRSMDIPVDRLSGLVLLLVATFFVV